MKTATRVKFDEIPLNHFFTDGVHIWKKVKSREVYNGSGGYPNFAPECPVMLCYDVLVPITNGHEKGSWTQNYFDTQFLYVSVSQEFTDKWIPETRAHLEASDAKKELEKT